MGAPKSTASLWSPEFWTHSAKGSAGPRQQRDKESLGVLDRAHLAMKRTPGRQNGQWFSSGSSLCFGPHFDKTPPSTWADAPSVRRRAQAILLGWRAG